MKNNRFVLWFLIPILMFAIAGAFAMNMTAFWYDEHMYITASVFVAQGKELYKDFAYLQTPYLPFLYGSLYRILGIESYYFFIGKLLSFLFLIISSVVLFLLARRVLHDLFLSLGIVTLFLLNINILNSAALATNFMMPVALSIISFYLFYISFIENQIKLVGITFAGIFLALAIGTKFTYATAVIPFVMIIICYLAMEKYSYINIKKNSIYSLLFYIAGLTVGLLPILFFISDFDSFSFNNLGFHNVNAHWRQITDFDGPMSLYAKLAFAHKQYFKSDTLILLLGIMLGAGLSIKSSQTMRQAIQQIHSGAFLTFFLVLITAITALIPTPSWPHYYSIPIGFLFILFIFSCVSDSEKTSILHKRLVLILIFVTAAYNGPHLLWNISRLAHKETWIALRSHDVSTNVQNVLIENGIATDRKIATLSPIYAIESNLPTYSELSTGPFLFRVGDLLTPEQRKHFAGTSAESLDDLFAEDPPAAILVDYEGGDLVDLNKPFIAYATINNYKKVYVAGLNGEFYVKP